MTANQSTDPTNKDHIEVTIRTAMVIKSLSSLVGARDPLLMELMMNEALDGIVELNNLIKRMRDAQKKSRTGT